MRALLTVMSQYLLLLSIVFSHFTQLHAYDSNKSTKTHTIVLGLTLSKTTLLTPKAAYKSTIKPSSETLDITEPLREIRDGYLVSLNLGTPPQIIQVYMDTGSDLTWVPCGNLSFDCIDCNDYRRNKLMPSFSPSSSSSCSRDSCASKFCIDVHSSDNSYDACTIAGCSLSSQLTAICSRPCPSFAYTYGGGVVTGSLTRDTLRVHLSRSSATDNRSVREVPKFCFGCVGTTYREPIGIAGFGRGSLSLPSQLGLLAKGFSHCFLSFKYANNPNITSPLVVGALAVSSKDYMQFTPMLNNPIYPNSYYIGLEALSVGNITSSDDQLPSRLKEFDSSGNGGTLIDSGTTYTHLPEPLYSWLLSTLQMVINYPRAEAVETRSGFDLCYRFPCPNNNLNALADDHNLPSIALHFLNNVTLVLPQGNVFYAMSAPSNSTVVKCLLFQSMGDDADEYGGPAGVFGSFQQQNVEVVYDLEKESIGFQPTDCAAAAASQGLHKM